MGDPAYVSTFVYSVDGGGDGITSGPVPGNYTSPACLGGDSW